MYAATTQTWKLVDPRLCLPVQVYDYQGKLLCAPKPQSMPLDALTPRTVALSPDTVAFLHPTTRTSVHFCSMPSGSETTDPLRIRREDDSKRLISDGSVAVMDIEEVALSQSGSQVLYLCTILIRW